MKKRLILSIVALIVIFNLNTNAQSIKVQSTVNYLKNRQLDKAKQAIDEAAVNEKTMNEPKTWYYRGTVYLELHLINTMTDGLEKGMSATEIKQKYREPISIKNVTLEDGTKAVRWEYSDQMYLYFKDGKLIKWDEPAGGKFKNLDSIPLMTAYESFQKSIALDNNKDFYEMNMLQLLVCGEQFFNLGAKYFNNKDFSNALTSFEKTIKINEIFKRQDSIATYYAGQSALLAKDTNTAIKYFKTLVNLKYPEPKLYVTLSDIYIKQGETNKALKIIETAKTILPDDYSIIVAEANIYILQGNMDEAQKLLELAIQKNPTNYILYYVIGTNYSNKLDQMVYENNPELYSKFYDMAEKYYKECLKLKPDMVEANFNLGALYFNEGLRILKQANNITDPIKLEQNEKMFKEKWEQATPYLEKALELQPNDISTLQTLRNLYARTNKLEKAQELDKKIKEINKK